MPTPPDSPTPVPPRREPPEAAAQFDVFPSHSAKDKAVVRPLTERLRKDGVNRRPPKLQPAAFILQPLACAPLNQERRFLPLRLDDAGSTARAEVRMPEKI